MPESEPLRHGGLSTQRRNPRPHSLIPDPDVPPLIPRWFHSINNPVIDPIALRKAKSVGSLNKKSPKPPAAPKPKPTSKWVPFSKRDSTALEKAFQNNDVRATVPVNEDHLFEVDVTQRTISPVYWEGPTFEVRRATWFMQGDGSKWMPCEENLAEQIELGYYKYKPYVDEASMDDASNSTSSKPAAVLSQSKSDDSTAVSTAEEKKLEMSLAKQPVEKQWNLLGPYLGQYIIYTGSNTAWLLSNSASSKLAKSIITRLTNKQNLGGTRLIRGYPEVEKQQSKSKGSTASAVVSKPADTEKKATLDFTTTTDTDLSANETAMTEKEEDTQLTQEAEDYDNENSEEEVRSIDHLIFVVHGVGQKMSERTGQTFVHDVNILRKTLKTAYPTAIASTATPQRSNGIQLLPIMWRQEIKFGMASDDEEGVETDLGTLGVDDGCPTLDELTLDGVPNLRTIVSDVLMDIPLYMTPKYRDQMTAILIREINRVYRLFVQRNPGFLERDGKVTIFGHSLGSMLAFDMLSMQPAGPIDPKSALSPATTDSSTRGNANDKKIVPLIFPVQNFFAVGSPLGVILLLKGHNIASRKSMGVGLSSFNESVSTPSSHITYCYPAVENLYNIFHKSDPVAYRLEPLIARQYSAKLKPEPVPYIKGGLKSVIDAGFNVGSGIANRAGAMYESFKMGLTTNLFMRGLGLSRQQIYEDMHPSSDNDDDPSPSTTGGSTTPTESLSSSIRTRSNSDPTRAFSGKSTYSSSSSSGMKQSHARKSPPIPLPTSAPYSIGARKLRMLNVTGRVDYCLQEGFLENPYLNAFNAHMQYWQDLDVAAFLVREIYR